jgi:hypothetical protein
MMTSERFACNTYFSLMALPAARCCLRIVSMYSVPFTGWCRSTKTMRLRRERLGTNSAGSHVHTNAAYPYGHKLMFTEPRQTPVGEEAHGPSNSSASYRSHLLLRRLSNQHKSPSESSAVVASLCPTVSSNFRVHS